MKLFYRKLGSGKPLIILHGLFGMSDNWLTIARRIARKHTVYMPDQRNHGQSPHSDTFNYDVLAGDLAAFIDEKGFDQVRLIGHSMGGKVSMKYAMNYPDRVEKLVVVDIAPRSYDSGRFDMFFKGMTRIEPGRVKSRTAVDEHLAGTIKNSAIRQFLLKNLKREEDNSFSWKVNLSAIQRNIGLILQNIDDDGVFKGDTLFVSGGKSDYIIASDHPAIKRMFPLAEIVTIPSASHWIHSDAPEEFCGHLRRFFY